MINRILIWSGLILTVLFALSLAKIEINVDLFGAIEPRKVIVELPFISALERQAYDQRVRWSASHEKDTRVVIVDIDERSLQEHAQWPWPRELFAELVDQLFDHYQIDTLGFDVTFPEKEESYTDAKVTELAQQHSDPQLLLNHLRQESGDVLFAKSFENRSVVLGTVFQVPTKGQELTPSFGQLPEAAFLNSEYDQALIIGETNAPAALRYTGNLPMLAEAAAASGFFSISPLVGDPDGIIRRVELLNKFAGRLYPSLSLQLIQTYFMDQGIPVIHDAYKGFEALRLIHADIPLDEQAAVYVPYAEQGMAYEYISATDILSGEYQGDIRGAIVLVGTSAPGLVDLRNTPVGAALPGVEVHANVLTALLDDTFRAKPSWITGADVLLVIMVGLLLSLALPRLSALGDTLLVGSLFASILGANLYLWQEQQLILALGPVLLLIVLIYFMDMVAGYFSETAARKATQKMFGLYVPPEVVSRMSNSADVFSLKSEKREMSVLFADIRNFTTYSESMDPQQLSEWLNAFLTPMTKIIHDNGGAIDKYMGDAIMAFWGAPLEDPDHAKHAVQAGIGMINHLEMLNIENRRKNWPEINIGVGLNSGTMSVGNMGSEFRMAYTVLGDAVNLGSRLEGLTKEYKVSIIASEFTRAAAPEFDYQELDRVKVKGKNDAVTIFACPADQKVKI